MLYKTESADETRRLAFKIARESKAGEIYCLKGDLGAGKTVFAQGFALGAGYNGDVTSPTFTLVHEYLGGRLPVYHFDLYRLENAEDLETLGYEEYFYGNGVCLIEWPERAEGIIPSGVRVITITAVYGENTESRILNDTIGD